MSVRASNWAWHESPQTIVGNELMVLLALADIADDKGECLYGAAENRTQRALARKARVSERTFRRAIQELSTTHGVLDIAQQNRMNIYGLRLEITEGSVRRSETDTGQSDLLVTSDEVTPIPATRGRSDRPAVAAHKNVLTKEINTSRQLNDLTTERRNDDDQLSHRVIDFPTPVRAAAFHPTAIDRAQLAASVGHYFADSGIDDNQLHQIALTILGRATSHVTDPTRYVVAAIRNDSIAWQKYAFDLVADLHSRGGNPF